MPPKKKNQQNDFYFFLQDQKKVFQREGRSWDSMQQLVELCSPRWNTLPEKERLRYKNMAKQAKEKEKGNLANKFDALGRSLLDIEREKSQKEQQFADMMREIGSTIDEAKKNGTLLKKKFFFIHFNVLFESSSKDFYPCEMAVLEFSLQSGIIRILHSFMNPEEATELVGYSYEIQSKADKTHGLTPSVAPLKFSEAQNWEWIIAQLISFLKDNGGTFPPLYTNHENVEIANSCLDYLFSKSVHVDKRAKRNLLKIFHVHRLLEGLADTLEEGGVCHHLHALKEIETDAFAFKRKMACPFHDFHEKNLHCSLTHVKTWAYVISAFVSSEYNITPVQGRHIPYEFSKGSAPPLNIIHLCKWDPESDDWDEPPEASYQTRQDSLGKDQCERETPEPSLLQRYNPWAVDEADAVPVQPTAATAPSKWCSATAANIGPPSAPVIDDLDDFPSLGARSRRTRDQGRHEAPGPSQNKGNFNKLAAKFSKMNL